MKKLETWFQGTGAHRNSLSLRTDGPRDGYGSGTGSMNCLLTLCTSDRERNELVRILKRLYPEMTCPCIDPASKLVHFNNREETTRDMVEKIIHTWQLEHE